jgi:hypothetical protein
MFIIIIITGGGNWTLTLAPTSSWFTIASDSTGANLVAGTKNGGGIYKSSNGNK